jgi:eukaryotic-like serine/threonine-protein kinase
MVQIDVLRPALRQLAQGVAALHRAGKLHRDLKPSNVLVTPQGRVVILDFGLVSDVEPGRKLTFAGTPAYMAPEQLADQPATEASDWYAVGLMLYEALTGNLPFGGDSPYAMLMEKQHGELIPPSSLVRGVPHDLDRLCIDLLRRDPESRPDGQEVLRRLSKRSTDRLPTPKAASLDIPFVGRDHELQQMHAASASSPPAPPARR